MIDPLQSLQGFPAEEVEAILEYQFSNREILLRALTHRSYYYENESENVSHNESLEFLGDAVLGFIVSAILFARFPDLPEGDLSRIRAYLVSADNLVSLAQDLRLGDFLRLSRGEEKSGGRHKKTILVDAVEAVIGAVYLDGGVDAAVKFISGRIQRLLDGIDIVALTGGDAKSALQEHLHSLGYPEPAYRVIEEIGPDHDKTFVVEVRVQDGLSAQGSGPSKKSAQQTAAAELLRVLKQ